MRHENPDEVRGRMELGKRVQSMCPCLMSGADGQGSFEERTRFSEEFVQDADGGLMIITQCATLFANLCFGR